MNCEQKEIVNKDFGNSVTQLFISRFESAPEKLLCFDAYKIPHVKAV